jgi:hypothetical protein
VRVLAPGGVLMLQLPEFLPAPDGPQTIRSILRPRTRAGLLLRRLGVSPTFLYRHLRWAPAMTMRAMTPEEVSRQVAASGGRLAWQSEPIPDPSGVRNTTYLFTR